MNELAADISTLQAPKAPSGGNINVGARASRTQYQYTLQDTSLDELDAWAPKLLGILRRIPLLQDVATDQQSAGPTLAVEIDRDAAARFGIQPQEIDDTLYDAFGQRQVATMFTYSCRIHRQKCIR